MLCQVMSHALRSMRLKNFKHGHAVKHFYAIKKTQPEIFSKPLFRHKSKTSEGFFSSGNVVMVTGVGLLAGVMFYVGKFYVALTMWVTLYINISLGSLKYSPLARKCTECLLICHICNGLL